MSLLLFNTNEASSGELPFVSRVVMKSVGFERCLVLAVNSNILLCLIFCGVFHSPKHILNHKTQGTMRQQPPKKFTKPPFILNIKALQSLSSVVLTIDIDRDLGLTDATAYERIKQHRTCVLRPRNTY